MAGAGELVRRARENRRGASRTSAGPQFAAGEERAVVERQPERFAEGQSTAPKRAPLQPHHAAYSALMRSHDRMRTQHLPVQGGGDRA